MKVSPDERGGRVTLRDRTGHLEASIEKGTGAKLGRELEVGDCIVLKNFRALRGKGSRSYMMLTWEHFSKVYAKTGEAFDVRKASPSNMLEGPSEEHEAGEGCKRRRAGVEAGNPSQDEEASASEEPVGDVLEGIGDEFFAEF